MGLNGTQHLMRAAGIDPENPVGSLLDKMGIDPKEVLKGFQAFKTAVDEMNRRQERIEWKLDKLLENMPDRIDPSVDDVLNKLMDENPIKLEPACPHGGVGSCPLCD